MKLITRLKSTRKVSVFWFNSSRHLTCLKYSSMNFKERLNFWQNIKKSNKYETVFSVGKTIQIIFLTRKRKKTKEKRDKKTQKPRAFVLLTFPSEIIIDSEVLAAFGELFFCKLTNKCQGALTTNYH